METIETASNLYLAQTKAQINVLEKAISTHQTNAMALINQQAVNNQIAQQGGSPTGNLVNFVA